jgi:S1-C subfamily serine protease
VPAKVIWEDPKIDAAVLKIPDGIYPSLALRSLETDTHTGEAIYLWGYPFGGRLSDDLNELQPSLFQGYISSIQTKNGLERINTNMEAKRGCSGGPVFSKKDGTILGILCGSQTVGDEGLMEEINYVLPVKYILEKVFHLNKASFVPGGD